MAGSSSNEKRVGEVGGNRVVVGGFHLHDDRQILRDGSTDTCNHADSLQHGTVRRNFPDRELILVTDHSGYRALTSGLLPRLIIHHDQSSCDSGCARDNSILLLVYDVSLRLIYFSKSMYIYICIYIYTSCTIRFHRWGTLEKLTIIGDARRRNSRVWFLRILYHPVDNCNYWKSVISFDVKFIYSYLRKSGIFWLSSFLFLFYSFILWF